MERVEQTSKVPAPAAKVWARAVSPEGINDELRPWLRMTVPRDLRGMTIDDAPLGETVGRSWLLLLRVMPFDYDDLRLVELEAGRRFLERSTMLSMRVWEHERVIEPVDERTSTVTDRLGIELRAPLAAIPGASRLARGIVTRIFRHRHRRMAAHFGP